MKFTLLTILEIKHVSKDGKILWEAKNLCNTFHSQGEDFILRAVFLGGQANTYIPEDYYFGLDNRATISVSDTIDLVTQSEPYLAQLYIDALEQIGLVDEANFLSAALNVGVSDTIASGDEATVGSDLKQIDVRAEDNVAIQDWARAGTVTPGTATGQVHYFIWTINGVSIEVG
jgi:hypothetical protein